MAKIPDIPTQITRAREAAGLSQEALGDKMGKNQAWICNVEAGRRRPNLEHLEAFAVALGCTFVVGPGAWPKGGA